MEERKARIEVTTTYKLYYPVDYQCTSDFVEYISHVLGVELNWSFEGPIEETKVYRFEHQNKVMIDLIWAVLEDYRDIIFTIDEYAQKQLEADNRE